MRSALFAEHAAVVLIDANGATPPAERQSVEAPVSQGAAF